MLGGAYDPSKYSPVASADYLWSGGSIDGISGLTATDTVEAKYNYIRTLNGAFVETSDSSVTLQLKSDIPFNYATNPIDTSKDANNNVHFGAFTILPIVPIRFPASLTSITARPTVNLCDIEFTPWQR